MVLFTCLVAHINIVQDLEKIIALQNGVNWFQKSSWKYNCAKSEICKDIHKNLCTDVVSTWYKREYIFQIQISPVSHFSLSYPLGSDIEWLN